ncbi:MAG: polyphosphate polymerase domain-containing protein [Candidatus Azobacteroides sp.]|nr:polyphosphate polymerase domain-containing protein [Candidatus Azobacteroides sp.]
MIEIDAILKTMPPIALNEVKNIRLMERKDFKFVACISFLPQLLEAMIPYFRVQVVKGKRIAPYSTQYLDTPYLDMYVMHRKGVSNRQKIRIRSYVDSNVSFLEIKNKNTSGWTNKVRVPNRCPEVLSGKELAANKQFLSENSAFDMNKLEPSLISHFDRITLVNNEKTERVTIDLNISFANCRTGKTQSLDKIMVLELKQDGWQYSPFWDIIDQFRIMQFSFSKYCVGIALTNPDVHNKLI